MALKAEDSFDIYSQLIQSFCRYAENTTVSESQSPAFNAQKEFQTCQDHACCTHSEAHTHILMQQWQLLEEQWEYIDHLKTDVAALKQLLHGFMNSLSGTDSGMEGTNHFLPPHQNPTLLKDEEIVASALNRPSVDINGFEENITTGAQIHAAFTKSPKKMPATSTPRKSEVLWSCSPTLATDGYFMLPDIILNPLDGKKLVSMLRSSNYEPHRFAELLFQHHVPHSLFQLWANKVNFDGSRGKLGLPRNLMIDILHQTSKRFVLGPKEKRKIKTRLNLLLRTRQDRAWWDVGL
ncbi:protein Pat [Xenopus laevis]|uniref:Protein Pat n=1 Tax=Xenopus laevis TaxID=8355 RepID=PAT_XENLA|nr:protein Pat [Xenopus laevis]O73622.2 RecName: Full=Protein Pat; AltName: Full=Primordial germ cell-associated transcript protein; AltName: Full=Xpat [Xenopus laevis]AAH72773.1 Xpat-A protein [Xenopus laevis]CAA05358.2 Xpat protein [Xenopus laevis]